MLDDANPFHAGELDAQARVGVVGLAERVGPYVRPYMPDQHRAFFAQLPFLVLAGADGDGRYWVTVLDGPDGFVTSPDPQVLKVAATLDPGDPLAPALASGTEIGMIGIELATRRRNRLSGVVAAEGDGFSIKIRQSFGNCPQYIRQREWHRVADGARAPTRQSDSLSDDQIARIRRADTLFIGTGQMGQGGHASDGFDASHRGGAPGFVAVPGPGRLRIPDYAGNNFFNTIGNLLQNPRIGLVFVDFETGGLLQVTGRARVDWEARDSHDPGAQRMIDVDVEAVVERPGALSLRWTQSDADLRELVVTETRREAAEITSFYLAAADGGPLPPFKAGQHLPVELDIPGQLGATPRSYSLSGPPGTYRLSVKRDPQGLASRFLHDGVRVGDKMRARAPSGTFMVPPGQDPLVLISAGVGLTPMVAMLHEVAALSPDRPVWFLHGARNGDHHALKAEVAELVGAHGAFEAQVFYSQPEPSEDPGRDGFAVGRLMAARILDLGAGPRAQYMLCGPSAFLADLRRGLEAGGVATDRIHAEVFGAAA